MSSGIVTTITNQVWDLGDQILKTRFARAIDEGVARYPIHRSLRFAARISLEALFDQMAMLPNWRATRPDSHSLLMDSDHAFITARGGRKADYCSCFFGIWAETVELAEKARTDLLALVAGTRITEPMFSIEWHFRTSKGELESASIEELADDVLLDAAYPELSGGVHAFITRYLDAPETVLVLQGPPGTGKTRLIRAILGAMSQRNGHDAQALYTGDMKALESDELFVKFITGWDDAFVVEDADHLLKPRAAGNEHLHRFLAIADGVVRAQGRKIIFSTNLPNIQDLDDALVRPGRCFARIHVRNLSTAEAKTMLDNLCENTQHSEAAQHELFSDQNHAYSLAAIYQAVGRTRQHKS